MAGGAAFAAKAATSAFEIAGDIFGYYESKDAIEDVANTDIATINLQLNNQVSTLGIKFRQLGSSQVAAEGASGFSVTSQSFLMIKNNTLAEHERENTQLKEEAQAEIRQVQAKEDAAKDKAKGGLFSGIGQVIGNLF